MILIDFSHLAMRNLFTSVYNAKPKKKDGKFITEQFIGMFFHQMLNSLDKIKNKFDYKDEKEIILALDGRGNWRKDVSKYYKGTRKEGRDKSDINFEEYYKYLNEFIDELKNTFGYKSLQVDKTEADDIIFVLGEKFKDRVTAISSDKDFKIILKYGCKLYDPIKDLYVNMTEDEIDNWLKIHIMVGDKADNVFHIKWNTEFTSEFHKHLRLNDFLGNELDFFYLSLEEQSKYIDSFDVWYINKKGEPIEKKIYKKVRFGEKTAEKLIPKLNEYFSKENREKDYRRQLEFENFILNKKLVHPSGIPEDIKEKIIESYNIEEGKINKVNENKFYKKYNLRERMNRNKTAFYF